MDQKNGVIHVTSGGGGGRLEDVAPTPAFFKQEGRVDYHFCYVTIHQGEGEKRKPVRKPVIADGFVMLRLIGKGRMPLAPEIDR